MKVSIFTFLLLFCFANSFDLPCRFSDKSFGKCVDIRNCKSIYTLYRQGKVKVKDLSICDHTRRFVCCPRISAEKCKEYGKALVNIARIPSLLEGGSREVIIGTKCQHVPTSLVVGGQEAKLYEFPHQALLGYQMNKNLTSDEVKWNCGGSLISPDFVLTAAHCISSPTHGSVKFVKFAVLDRSYDDQKTVVFAVKETVRYSNDRQTSRLNDIGLVKLQGSVEINEFILPACLPTRPYFDEKATVTGFGDTGTGILSQKLLKVVIEKFDHQACKDQFEEKYIESTMLCYGHKTLSRDSCGGDSGGPLQVSNDEYVNCTYTVFGVVSYGPTFCGIPKAPSSYVNVYSYLDWIEGIVWKDEI